MKKNIQQTMWNTFNVPSEVSDIIDDNQVVNLEYMHNLDKDIQYVSNNYTMNNDDYVVEADTQGGDLTITIPSSPKDWAIYTIINKPQKNQWQTKNSMPNAVSNALSLVYNNEVYVIWWKGPSGATNTNMIYDIWCDTFSLWSVLPESKYDIGGVVVGDNMYVFGWRDDVSSFATVYKYDIIGDARRVMTSMPVGRSGMIVWENNNKVHLVWWYDIATDTYYDRHDVYDIATNSWSTLSSFPRNIAYPYYYNLNGQIYVLWGKNENGIFSWKTWWPSFNQSVYIEDGDYWLPRTPLLLDMYAGAWNNFDVDNGLFYIFCAKDYNGMTPPNERNSFAIKAFDTEEYHFYDFALLSDNVYITTACIYNNIAYVFGGYDPNTDASLNGVYSLDLGDATIHNVTINGTVSGVSNHQLESDGETVDIIYDTDSGSYLFI